MGLTLAPICRGRACLFPWTSARVSRALPYSRPLWRKKNRNEVSNSNPFNSPIRCSSTFTSYKTGDWTRRQQQRDICNPFLGIPLAPPPTVFSSDEWRDFKPSPVEEIRHALHGLKRFSKQVGVLNEELLQIILLHLYPDTVQEFKSLCWPIGATFSTIDSDTRFTE